MAAFYLASNAMRQIRKNIDRRETKEQRARRRNQTSSNGDYHVRNDRFARSCRPEVSDRPTITRNQKITVLQYNIHPDKLTFKSSRKSIFKCATNIIFSRFECRCFKNLVNQTEVFKRWASFEIERDVNTLYMLYKCRDFREEYMKRYKVPKV